MLQEHRLVTVTGPGGVGKTRLADQVARQVAGEYADGVWLVELASVPDPDAVPRAVADALAVQPPDAPVAEALAEVLARRQLLLVLDNCEHVLAGVAALCASVLSVADDVRILATSREPVGVAAEARYRLPPLTLPSPGNSAEFPGCDAVAFFADRARQADRHFTISRETGPVVARLVTRLDGMPLAIELAAARIEALGVTGLADRLDDRFRWLVGTDRLAADRQRSLAATVDWSYELLTEREQRVFRKLAIFPAAFTMAAAEAVAGQDAGQAVLRLVDCSMLAPPHAGPDGRARYVMLETLRSYGTDRLAEASEQQETAAALAGFAVWTAEQAAPDLLTSAEDEAGRWLDAEDAALHQSLAWALDHDQAIALRLAVALGRWWGLRGRYASGYESLTAAIGHAIPGSADWCQAQLWLGNLSSIRANVSVSLDHFTAVRDAVTDRKPSPTSVWALNGRAGCLATMGRLDEAAQDARRALDLARQLGDPFGEVLALFWLGGVAHYAGDPERSLPWMRQTSQVDPRTLPGSMVRRCSQGLAMALAEAGQLATAARHFASTLAMARQAADVQREAYSLLLLGTLDLRTDRVAAAAAHLRETIEIATRNCLDLILLDVLDAGAHFCAQTERWAGAITLWAAYSCLLRADEIPDPAQDVQRRLEPLQKAREQLGPAEASAAEERGMAMTLAIAAEYAMLLVTAEEQQRPATAADTPQLSPREWELITLVARGSTDAQIAGQLYISLSTVRSHLDRIRDKTGCRRRADLTRLALQASLV